jgi:hypothetical protein
MDIKEHFEFISDQSEIYVKDASLVDFRKKFHDFDELTRKMRTYLPDGYRYYLVDLVVQDCVPSQNTCRDIRWHFDGDYNKDNKYVLWVSGPNRTQFPKIIGSYDPPAAREEQNEYLEKILSDIEVEDIPDSTIVAYDSKTPHRGVKCKEYGKRVFFRMMASNYIRPKIIKEMNLAQVRQKV